MSSKNVGPSRGESGGGSGSVAGRRAPSLRAQLLIGLAVLLVIALLGLVVVGLAWLPVEAELSGVLLGIAGLVIVDVAVLVFFGDYLVDRLVLRPVERMAEGAARIAEGEHEHRVRPSGSEEMRRLAGSLNRMADRLIRNQRKLQQNIRSLDETNQALTEAKNELVRAEKLATVGRLAAGIAHEVGNPLNAIMGYVELARRKSEAEGEWVDGIAHEASRIDRIVRGLLDYAQPKEARLQRVSPNEVVEGSLQLLDRQGRFRDVEVRTELAESLPEVRADPDQLQQVLVNLLLNSTDAIEDAGGNGTINVGTRRRPASEIPAVALGSPRRTDDPEGIDYRHLRRLARSGQPTIRTYDELVEIRVEDDGVGLPEDQVSRLFDPFYTTKYPGRGTGLGLAVSSRLVGEMGGVIRGRAREGGGAVFSVLLPPLSGEEEA